MIEGELVNLRALEMGDLERLHRWVNDREVSRYVLTRYPWSLQAEEAWLREQASRPMSYGEHRFAIETKDGRHIGNTGLHASSPEDRSASLGIMIGEKDCWGQGYGTDAVRTLARFGFEEMNLNRIELHVYDFNTRAIAAYRKCGFMEEGATRGDVYQGGRYVDVVIMGLLRRDWEAMQ